MAESNTLDYNTKFGDHSLEVLAGYTTQKFYQTLRTVDNTGFATDETPFVQAATTTTGTTNSQEWTLASALARVNYDYKKRHYISGTIRNDGSSRFGAVRKYGTFPSVSVAWVASEEKFFPKMGALNFLKFRGSYGLTGNNNIGNYTWVSLLSSTNYVFNGATTLGRITNLGNSDLTWETSKQLDIGAELTLLHGRLNISYDYYNKRTEGMLTPLPVPYASGYESIQYNEGVFRIWGHEYRSVRTISSRITSRGRPISISPSMTIRSFRWSTGRLSAVSTSTAIITVRRWGTEWGIIRVCVRGASMRTRRISTSLRRKRRRR